MNEPGTRQGGANDGHDFLDRKERARSRPAPIGEVLKLSLTVAAAGTVDAIDS